MNKQFKQITLCDYNPNWPKMFEVEADLLRKILGSSIVEVHHIGSTAVPGLRAKEDLDILCVVDQLSSSLDLQDVGYVFKGELNIPLRYFFSKNNGVSKVNLHVTEKDHGFIKLNLCFRDYLRTHPDAVVEYAQLKDKLLQDPKNFERVAGRFPGYTLGKDQFIKNILDKAEFNDVTINFCLHDRELEEYCCVAKGRVRGTTNHYHFVLYHGTKIVAIARIEFLHETEAALQKLVVDAPYQNQKFDTKMWMFLEKWCKHHGRNVFLYSQQRL